VVERSKLIDYGNVVVDTVSPHASKHDEGEILKIHVYWRLVGTRYKTQSTVKTRGANL